MIVEKGEFKELKQDGGGIFKAIHASSTLEYGPNEVKTGTPINLYIMTNGILGDVILGKKIYIRFESVNEATAVGENLTLDFSENGIDNQIVFRIKNSNELNKVYNSIRQYCNLGYREIENIENNIPQKSKRQEEKERLKQFKKDHVPYCPKCHSTSIHYIEKRKRLSMGRTIVGGTVGSLVNPLGTAAGAMMGGLTSNKMKKGEVKCLNCGHTWKL
ncbi:hypothetical protein KPL33_01070 [Clostridium algidicarnis]|nr:hypothetical protein [Clostridium algidicarnis]MBU3205569.1 hypothetical protein [Clostridium algidicarnis]